jgi:hypothetical protein
VAYWCVDEDLSAFTTQCPGATRFTDMSKMLEAYHFPTSALAAHWGQERFIDEEGVGWRVIGALQNPPNPVFQSQSTQIPAFTNAQTLYDRLVPMLSTATPGGRNAIRHALGLEKK